MVWSTKPRLASTGPPKWIGRSPAARPGLDPDLVEQALEGQAVDQPVDHQPHRAFGGMGAEIDHAAGETRVRHLRHRDQQLAGERAFSGIVIAMAMPNINASAPGQQGQPPLGPGPEL